MTKLEEEIANAIYPVGRHERLGNKYDHAETETEVCALIAAEVAKKYIDSLAKFLIENNTSGHNKLGGILRTQYEQDYQKWLKENGVTE